MGNVLKKKTKRRRRKKKCKEKIIKRKKGRGGGRHEVGRRVSREMDGRIWEELEGMQYL